MFRVSYIKTKPETRNLKRKNNMCGIVCAFDIKKSAAELRPQILTMSKKIRHRGPDWSGIYAGEKAILAHAVYVYAWLDPRVRIA